MFKGALVVGLVAGVVTLVLAAPVVFAPSSRIFGQAIVGSHHDPFTVMAQFQGQPTVGLYVQPLTDWIGRLLTVMAGPVVAYNIVVLVTFPLAAIGGYLLAFHLTGSHPGSLVAALIFAFSPFHLAHAAYHAHVVQVQWLPLYLLALWRCLDRPTPRRLLLVVAAAGAVSLASFYLGFIAAVMSPVFMLAYWLAGPYHAGHRPRTGLIATTMTLATLGVVGLLATAALYRRAGYSLTDTTVLRSELFTYSARWWSYLVPAVDHPLLGAWARSVWETSGVGDGLLEQQVYVGWSTLVLGAIPLWAWVRGDRTSPGARAAPALVAVALYALLCSWAPEWQVGMLRLPGPSSLLYELAPMFRAYARFGVVVTLIVALLAGIGTARLLAARSRASTVAVAVLLAGIALEYAPVPPWPSRDVLPTRAHRWLADREISRRVLECVTVGDIRERASLWLMPHEIVFLDPTVEDCGEPGLSAKLAALGIGHVIASPSTRAGQWLTRAEAPGGLRLVQSFPDSLLFEVPSERPRLFVRALRGFAPREYGPDRTWRWMHEQGSLELVNATKEVLATILTLEVLPSGHQRPLRVRLDGREAADIALPTGFSQQPVGPLTVSPGVHRLELAMTNGSTTREPTLALGSWQWTELERP